MINKTVDSRQIAKVMGRTNANVVQGVRNVRGKLGTLEGVTEKQVPSATNPKRMVTIAILTKAALATYVKFSKNLKQPEDIIINKLFPTPPPVIAPQIPEANVNVAALEAEIKRLTKQLNYSRAGVPNIQQASEIMKECGDKLPKVYQHDFFKDVKALIKRKFCAGIADCRWVDYSNGSQTAVISTIKTFYDKTAAGIKHV